MFDADRPIDQSSEDRLNRSIFAKYLARCLLDHTDPDSLAVGLYGASGAGKTSLINLVVEELNLASPNIVDEEKPIVLNFSPWSYSGQQQLIYSFFRRLSATLRSVSYLENADRIIYLLELYVSFFTHQAVPHSLRAKPTWWEQLTGAKPDAGLAWESGKDLTLVKAELNELLLKQKHKIIIFIDNVSYLYPDEIKQIFQIVKSMGNYANTIYLLALDKTQIIQKINQLDGGGAERLLEKIVQLPFEVPTILQQDLSAILNDKLQDIMLMVPEGTWDKEYWADIYHYSLKFFFHNCRDITRYVNTLNFSYSRLRDVVNPVDFFALTAIEVFLPTLYIGIRDNKDLFSDLLDDVYQLEKIQLQKDKLRCDEILSRHERVGRDIILTLLMRLFPRLRHLYEPDVPFYHSLSLARKLRRACSPDLFDVYFRLSMQSSRIPQSEFDTILSLAADPVAFDQAITRLNQDDRATKFLDQLDSQVLHTVPLNYVPAIINALFDNGDLFPQGITGPLNLDTPRRIHRIIHTLLRRFKQADERFMLLQQAIANTNKSLYIIIHELIEQGHEHMVEADTFLPLEFRDLTTEQLDSLRKLAVGRIHYWAEIGRLSEHPRLLSILFAWSDWGGEKECKLFVNQLVKSDRGLICFLLAALDKAVSQAMTKYEHNPEWQKYIEDIRHFVSIKKIKPHAVALFEDEYFEKLREREQWALMIFLALIKAETKKIIPRTTI